MFFVGITGGVGAGKSEILGFLREHYNSRVLLTDEIAHDLMEPGTECYSRLKEIFGGDSVYLQDGHFDRPALARVIFSDAFKRDALNAIVHPAVKAEVKRIAGEERLSGEIELLVVEAALLIEEKYDEVCDELWYIYTSEENRRARLKASRGYSDEKIDGIFASQLKENVFREHCKVVIDNNGTPQDAFAQISKVIEEKLHMSEISRKIRNELFEMQDPAYRDFHAKLIPTVEKERIIGVRTPQLRKYAKQMAKEPGIQAFLEDVPHLYYDENNLHMFLLEQIKDYDTCMERMEAFLPYVDNWATCDMGAPKVFAKHTEALMERIKVWLASDQTYTIRYGIGMLMRLFLDDKFKLEYPAMVAELRSEEYYVNMMIAWYFATALAKQYDAILPFIENQKLDVWTHNKAIQKACESYRITPEQKMYLRKLKIKK